MNIFKKPTPKVVYSADWGKGARFWGCNERFFFRKHPIEYLNLNSIIGAYQEDLTSVTLVFPTGDSLKIKNTSKEEADDFLYKITFLKKESS